MPRALCRSAFGVWDGGHAAADQGEQPLIESLGHKRIGLWLAPGQSRWYRLLVQRNPGDGRKRPYFKALLAGLKESLPLRQLRRKARKTTLPACPSVQVPSVYPAL